MLTLVFLVMPLALHALVRLLKLVKVVSLDSSHQILVSQHALPEHMEIPKHTPAPLVISPALLVVMLLLLVV